MRICVMTEGVKKHKYSTRFKPASAKRQWPVNPKYNHNLMTFFKHYLEAALVAFVVVTNAFSLQDGCMQHVGQSIACHNPHTSCPQFASLSLLGQDSDCRGPTPSETLLKQS